MLFKPRGMKEALENTVTIARIAKVGEFEKMGDRIAICRQRLADRRVDSPIDTDKSFK
jgi:hypothetical protein